MVAGAGAAGAVVVAIEAGAVKVAGAAAGAAAGVATVAMAEGKAGLLEVRRGEDVLSVVAGSVSRQSRTCDKFLHCFADIGLPCADRHRKLLLSLCVLLGIAFFGFAVCGATALGPNHMRVLPWGQVLADAGR